MVHPALLALTCSLLLAALTVATLQATAQSTIDSTNRPIRKITGGFVEGLIAHDGQTEIYHSIPYAAPPVDDNRFRAPQPVEPFDHVVDGSVVQNACPQLAVTSSVYIGYEDCLYLSVYTPHRQQAANDEQKLLPVMFWIHGGAFKLGSGYQQGLYDGSELAKQGVVVVAINYRLASLGFLALPELAKEDEQHSYGNMAMQDQVAALKWVQENIAQFGGDRSNVVIFGESAGGFSVCYHLASPLSANLFHAAIMESGTCEASAFFLSSERSVNNSRQLVDAVGCSQFQDNPDVLLKCLRSVDVGVLLKNSPDKLDERSDVSEMSVEQYNTNEDDSDIGQDIVDVLKDTWNHLVSDVNHVVESAVVQPIQTQTGDMLRALHGDAFGSNAYVWGPTVDGVALTDTPLGTIQSGSYNAVPTIAGTNTDEGSIFVRNLYKLVDHPSTPLDSRDLHSALLKWFNGNETAVRDILLQYPLESYNNDVEAVGSSIITDFFFLCPTKRALTAMVDNGNADVYQYQFAHRPHWIDVDKLGTYHSLELYFVFKHATPPLIHSFDEQDVLVSVEMQAWWTSFAKYHSPNGQQTQRMATMRKTRSPLHKLQQHTHHSHNHYVLAHDRVLTDGQSQWQKYDAENKSYLIINAKPQLAQDERSAQCKLWDGLTEYN